jgi:indolepyruvate ferredoxin oxidoreductase beta subunit
MNAKRTILANTDVETSITLPLDLIIAGVGGQGSLYASKVIAQAAFYQGVSVRVAETYGVAQRGGSVYSQIRLGYEVCGPMIPKGSCHQILGLEPIEAMRRSVEYLAPGGIVVLNTRVNAPLETKMGKQPDLEITTIQEQLNRLEAGVLVVDAWTLAQEAGGPATMNVVMLGALLSLEGFPLTYEAMVEAIGRIGKQAYREQNLLSLARGQEYAFNLVRDRRLSTAHMPNADYNEGIKR